MVAVMFIHKQFHSFDRDDCYRLLFTLVKLLGSRLQESECVKTFALSEKEVFDQVKACYIMIVHNEIHVVNVRDYY